MYISYHAETGVSLLSSHQKFISEKNHQVVILNQQAKLNATIKVTSPDKIKLTSENHCLKCKLLEQELSKMRCALDNMVKLFIFNLMKILKHSLVETKLLYLIL